MLMTERKTSLPCTSPVSSTEQLICVLQLLAMRGYSQLNSFFNTSALLIWLLHLVNKQFKIFALYFQFIKPWCLLNLCVQCRAIRKQIAVNYLTFRKQVKLLIKSRLTKSWSIVLLNIDANWVKDGFRQLPEVKLISQ